MTYERLLNYYYNIGGYNNPELIGYMMSLIRNLKPLTVEEWEIWYTDNIHDKDYIEGLSIEMWKSIPSQYEITPEICMEYVYDVMFRRTFQGYNKEKQALKFLRQRVSEYVQEAPKEWDTEYFIDFFIPECETHPIIGIQLKPDTFFKGHYQNFVDIEGKMNRFMVEYRALAYILKYKQIMDEKRTIEFTNPEVITEIVNNL